MVGLHTVAALHGLPINACWLAYAGKQSAVAATVPVAIAEPSAHSPDADNAAPACPRKARQTNSERRRRTAAVIQGGTDAPAMAQA